MISFECDYNNGAHPRVMQRLVDTNAEQTLTYGFDHYSERAKEKIRQACGCDEAQVFLLTGGTQTNATVIDGVLRSYEAVIAVESGHINIHEAGAIEMSGHRVIALKGENGKLSAATLQSYMQWFEADESRDHLAQPGMVYISFPTELGTIYTAAELEAIYDVCRQFRLHLYIDGARMGYGLAASHGDVSLPWLCQHCDVLYIGGTKVGALCGEAVVFTHGNAPERFFSIMKRHGAVLAKGRLTGVQFDALFTYNLYFDISEHAINMARKLKDLLRRHGMRFFIDSPTNQQFVIMDNSIMHTLEKHVLFTHWEPFDSQHTVCRFVTSWATTDEDLQTLASLLEQYAP